MKIFPKNIFPAVLLAVSFLILLALVIAIGSGGPISSPIHQAKGEIAGIETALARYEADHGNFPQGASNEICQALTPYFRVGSLRLNGQGDILDPWGKPYQIIYRKDDIPLVRSSGPNKEFDDISNESY